VPSWTLAAIQAPPFHRLVAFEHPAFLEAFQQAPKRRSCCFSATEKPCQR